MNNVSITQNLYSLPEVIRLIEQNHTLCIAADESFLEKLPSGNWIGGTTPYFMTENGGVETKDMAFVQSINGQRNIGFGVYDERTISRLCLDSNAAGGFTILILPYGSPVHQIYAEQAPYFEGMFDTPIIGWVSGHSLKDDNPVAKTAFGTTSSLSDKHAVAIHISMDSKNQLPSIGIVNPFLQSPQHSISFQKTGFEVENCIIDGREVNFSEYIEKNDINIKMPLVADYCGTNVNVSIKSVAGGKVQLYAPVFEGAKYSFADNITDYVAGFNKVLNSDTNANNASISVNCILNYAYSELEGKRTGNLIGPVTFGEVAYQLVNQTAVYLTI